MRQNKIVNLIININMFILLLWCNPNCNANEISLLNEYEQIGGTLSPNGNDQIILKNGKDKMTYLCTVDLSEAMENFTKTIKPNFLIWDIVDRGKSLSFRFIWQVDMTFTIENTKNRDIYYSVQCLKPSQSECEHDGFRYENLKDTLSDKYGSPVSVTNIIAEFAGFHHSGQNTSCYYGSHTYRETRDDAFDGFLKLFLGIPFSSRNFKKTY